MRLLAVLLLTLFMAAGCATVRKYGHKIVEVGKVVGSVPWDTVGGVVEAGVALGESLEDAAGSNPDEEEEGPT
jgi:predicted small secreted protein